MEFIQNMGWFPMPEFPCPLLLVRFVPQDENYKKKGRGHSSCYSHFQPNPVPTSCMKAYYTQKTKNDT